MLLVRRYAKDVCLRTTTKTKTTTVTYAPTTATTTASVTNTNTVTNTITSIVTSTVEETSTSVESITIPVTYHIPATDSVTVTSTGMTTTITSVVTLPTSTITVTTGTVTGLVRRRKAKRSASITPLPSAISLDSDIHARFAGDHKNPATTCTPTTAYPTHLPWYAWGCHGRSQYSSACSCAGVKTWTTTLPACTSTVTTTSTVSFTPTVTATTTVTNTNTATATSVVSQTTTITTTDATVVVPQTEYDTTTITVTATVISTDTITPPPVTTTVTNTPSPVTTDVSATCSTYNLVAVGGTYSGQYAVGGTPDTSTISYGFISFTTTQPGSTFTLRSNGYVYYGGNTYGLISNGNGLYYVLDMTDASQSTYGTTYLICSITPGTSSVASAIGTLQCTYMGSNTKFYTCPDEGNYLFQDVGDPSSQAFSCSELSLAAIPAC